VKDACRSKGWEFQLAAGFRELAERAAGFGGKGACHAEKQQAKQASEAVPTRSRGHR
jgi:hypothetical protein